MQILTDTRTVAPALEKYSQGPITELWKRPGLSLRDRSIVTLAALIARNQTVEMPYYVNLALDNGVKPRELSEIITHLAFYSGWANACLLVPLRKTFLPNAKSASTNCLPHLLRFFHWSRTRKQNAPPEFNRISEASLPDSCSTRPMFCFETCGCVQT
jgi:alkylhydroperoxidase/carboxymuconolactone decarboxylase family protein YurZ